MSRGPGKWQRFILGMVEEARDPETGFSQWVDLNAEVLSVAREEVEAEGQHLPRSLFVAWRRAVSTLAASGRIERDGWRVRLPPSHAQQVAQVKADALAAWKAAVFLVKLPNTGKAVEHNLAKWEAARARLGELDPATAEDLVREAEGAA